MQKLINKIVCGDCIEILSKARKPFADLIFADPPFNIGYKYDKYYDKVKSKNYIAWTREWMTVCRNVLKPHGSFYIAIGDEYAAHVRIIGEELGLAMRNWIIWHYTFGQQTKEKFARSHTHIFYFVADKNNFTFNDYAVRVPSDRQLIYNDKRANSKGKMPNDVWDQYSRVCGTFRERQVSSKPGDVVLDPFNGSGTTTVVACQLGRKYVGIDISENYVANAMGRLAQLKQREKSSKNLFGSFDATELLELKRLYVDIGVDSNRILDSKKLLGVFARQFAVRMNNGKSYSEEKIATALMDLAN